MNKEEVLAEVEQVIRAIPGVVEMRYLDSKLKDEIVNLETMAERNGACGGLMPFVNKGVWEVLKREVSLIIIGNAHFIVNNESLLYILDQKGQVIGEYVNPEQCLAIKAKDPNAHFLSDDFLLHPDVQAEGEPYFLIDEIRFQYLDNVKGIARITSGSVSTLSDDFVRNTLGYTGEKQWTHLVGFDLEK